MIGRSRSCLRATFHWGIAPFLFVFFSAAASAQFQTRLAFIFSPPNPQPGDSVNVFIRASDPVTGFVFCPETAKIITRVSVVGTSITLDLESFASPGGFIRPFCDGNTVSLGVLQAGTYTVTARIVFSNGNVGSTVLASQLLVDAAAAEPTAIPLFGPFGVIASAIMLALVGGWFLRVPSEHKSKSIGPNGSSTIENRD